VLVLPAMEANTNKVIVIRSYASSPFVSTSDRRPASAAPTALARAMQTLQNFGLVFRESRNGWWSLVTAALLEATQGFEGGPSSSAGGIRAVDAGADEVARMRSIASLSPWAVGTPFGMEGGMVWRVVPIIPASRKVYCHCRSLRWLRRLTAVMQAGSNESDG
jgi:hypothetical protein